MSSHPQGHNFKQGLLRLRFFLNIIKVHKDSYKLFLWIILNLGYYVYGMVNIHKRVVSSGRGNVLNQSFGMKFNSKIHHAIAFNSDLHIISVYFVSFILIFSIIQTPYYPDCMYLIQSWQVWIIEVGLYEENLFQRASLYGRYTAVPLPKSS